MRVISGSAKGRILAGFSGRDIRPTSDRIREAIFSILYSRLGSLAGKKVLDIFAGTGAMGIEALSRGAAEAFFVENNRWDREPARASSARKRPPRPFSASAVPGSISSLSIPLTGKGLCPLF